ncbi:hypothetical protein WNY51_08345 [Pseudocolwellia sp. AS88]|uniref:hypothetical protein n=1 Tax=Pseudocolwellia sp. AS88 TaxID=3063958 RepID=UPI0026EDEFF7|nr:hypothetical protein [Pseudocolwellia sp. AS88]MDO7085900.1 hypothetical protein [Pseudocolwellia sp. AS88]
MEQVLNWVNQNQTLAIIVAVIGLIIFTFSLRSTTTKIFASNRGVSIGGNSNGPIMTGDINAKRSGILSVLANIATILGLIVGAATLYITYLAFIEVG